MDDGGPISTRRIERVDAAGARQAARDRLVVEAPLELRVAGAPAMVLMRTPGADRELVTGLLYAEGVIARAEELAAMAPPADLSPDEAGNVLELGRALEVPARSLASSASCGVCGKTAIAELEVRAPAVGSPLQVSAAVVAALPARLRAAQAVFAATGGLHAAGLFDAGGEARAVREDVGRHNAVDKLCGWALGAGQVPLDDAVMAVSGRLGFEIVQKAVVAGVPVVVAVSAPSSLAVDLAERFRVTLCGFVREGRFNIYSHPWRVV
jgi:FdhD protein